MVCEPIGEIRTIVSAIGIRTAECWNCGLRYGSNRNSIDRFVPLVIIDRMHWRLALVGSLVASMLGCGHNLVEPPSFNGERAFRYLVEQVDLGPRVPGSDASAGCRDFLLAHFTAVEAVIDSQSFSFLDPYSHTTIPLVNFIAGFRGVDSARPGILLMAHYDSRPRTDFAEDSTLRDRPIDGANDGASGVAVLMELGNVFAARQPPCNVDLVMVDGEDWGRQGDLDYYLLGSREFGRQGIRGKYQFGIVVDMIGDAAQQIYRDGYSERFCKDVNDAIWKVAADLEVATFRDSVKYSIIDDHHSLIASGVSAVLLIDWEYPYWHTEFDTPDKCSPQSLENVGRVLARLIYNPPLWPKR